MKRCICFLLLLACSQISLAQEEDSVQQEKKTFAIYPALGYAPETHWTYGAIAFLVFEDKTEDGFYRPSSLTPYAIYTSKNQILTKTDLDLYLKSGLNIYSEVRFFNFPDNFYGIGNGTDPDIVEKFTNNFFRMNGRVAKPFSDNLFAGIYYDFQYNNIKDLISGGLMETIGPEGKNGGRTMGLGPGMKYDSRNSTLYPTDGKLFNAGITVFSKAFGSEYDYSLLLLDYRQYFEFLGPKNIVAFQFRTQLTTGDDIPFYKLPSIAGDRRLRGITHKNLYRDKQSMYFQVEGRQDLFWRFGGVIFAGVGHVFESFSNFDVHEFRYVYGLGGRFQAMRDQQLNIRMDLGFSQDGQKAFFLSVREAF